MRISKLALGLAFLTLSLSACSKEQDRRVKTPQERLEDELAAMDEQEEANAERNASLAESESETEEELKFDRAGAEHSLQRASIGARSCPDSFEESQLKDFAPGTAELTIVFANDGRVKEVTINELYKDTNVGNCVVRAFSSLHVKSYTGPEETMEWELELKHAEEE